MLGRLDRQPGERDADLLDVLVQPAEPRRRAQHEVVRVLPERLPAPLTEQPAELGFRRLPQRQVPGTEPAGRAAAPAGFGQLVEHRGRLGLRERAQREKRRPPRHEVVRDECRHLHTGKYHQLIQRHEHASGTSATRDR
jgi:hypothetical protein